MDPSAAALGISFSFELETIIPIIGPGVQRSLCILYKQLTQQVKLFSGSALLDWDFHSFALLWNSFLSLRKAGWSPERP